MEDLVRERMTNGNRKQVVIIGGGFAGVKSARGLENLPVDVTLIDKNSYHVFQPLLYQAALGLLAPSDITRPIRSILQRSRNIEVLMDEVTDIDRGNSRIFLRDGHTLSYDYLILAAGSTSSYFGHNEWSKYAPSLKSIEEALDIRTRVLLTFEHAEKEVSRGGPQPHLHFVVIGGGPTGVELAGAIANICRDVLWKEYKHVRPEAAKVSLYEAAPKILPMFPDDLQRKAIEQLTALGVAVHTNAAIIDIQADHIQVGHDKIPAITTIWAAGVAPSPLGAKLGLPLDRRGCVNVNEYLNPEGEPNIFVCGDLAAVTENGRRIPAVAQPAMQMGAHAAEMIAADLRGRSRTPFHYFDKGDMATIGRNAAVAKVVWPFRANWSGFMAWISWLLVHLVFLSGADRQMSVLFTWIYSYFTKTAKSRLIIGSKAL
jgi:NADH:quinone reductase (non-electrogenic)